MDIRWNADKNIEIKNERGVTFDQLLNSRFIGIEKNPKRSHQRLMLFEYKKYVWVVPYVREEGYYFLKTAFPSRKHTKKYLGGAS